MAVLKPVLFLLVIICTMMVIANQCGKHAEEKKVSDEIEKQRNEMKKEQENVKELIDRITSEIENDIKMDGCPTDCSGNFFEKYQDLPTSFALAAEAFTIDGSLFLAFANYGSKYKGYNLDSVIYKMDDSNGKFYVYQTIRTIGGRDIEYFTIADKHFLAIANHWNGVTSVLNSVIYKWDGRHFVPFQKIPTLGGTKLNIFKVFSEYFLAVANDYYWYRNPNAYTITSVIYKWKFNQFVKFQGLRIGKSFGSAAFVINNETLVVFANTQSPVFRWSGGRFVKLQSLKTNGARDVKSFTINDGTFLAFASFQVRGDYNTDSFVYKWNGTRFVLFQSIPAHGAQGWHPFVTCGWTYLCVATRHDDGRRSAIYQFSGSKFIKYQVLSTDGATDSTSFVYKGHTYLAISNYYSKNSALYKWV